MLAGTGVLNFNTAGVLDPGTPPISASIVRDGSGAVSPMSFSILFNSPGATVGAMLADPRSRKVSFTGSTEVGRVLLEQAAQQVLRSSMELGGNAPFVVLEDADLDAAVDGAMVAKMRNGGESCIAANRFLVHADVADEFSRRLAEQMAAAGAELLLDGPAPLAARREGGSRRAASASAGRVHLLARAGVRLGLLVQLPDDVRVVLAATGVGHARARSGVGDRHDHAPAQHRSDQRQQQRVTH